MLWGHHLQPELTVVNPFAVRVSLCINMLEFRWAHILKTYTHTNEYTCRQSQLSTHAGTKVLDTHIHIQIHTTRPHANTLSYAYIPT